jgi:hypothetical protein
VKRAGELDIEGINQSLRPVVGLVAILNLADFGVEFAVATAIGSVSLFADSVDFLEDASVTRNATTPMRGGRCPEGIHTVDWRKNSARPIRL